MQETLCDSGLFSTVGSAVCTACPAVRQIAVNLLSCFRGPLSRSTHRRMHQAASSLIFVFRSLACWQGRIGTIDRLDCVKCSDSSTAAPVDGSSACSPCRANSQSYDNVHCLCNSGPRSCGCRLQLKLGVAVELATLNCDWRASTASCCLVFPCHKLNR